MPKNARNASFLYGFLFYMLLLTPAKAQQYYFNESENFGKKEYHYKWRDLYGEAHQIVFKLQNVDIDKAVEKSQPLTEALIHQKILEELELYLERYARRGIDIRIVRYGSSIQFLARGGRESARKRAVADIQKRYDKAYDQVLTKQGYHMTEYGGQQVLMSDYKNIAKEEYAAFKPVVFEISRQATGRLRKKLNFALNFFQSIPYETPHREGSASSVRFQSPMSLITQNKGDCDEKSLAFGAVVRRMSMATPVYLVVIEGHALVALAMRPDKGDQYIKKNGQTLVLAEPTGPSMLPLGRITKYSATEIAANRYELIELPGLYSF